MSYRIVCTDQEPVHVPTTHAHIVSVGTGTDPNRADRKWSLAEVIQQIDRGVIFYTIGPRSGKTAYVRVVNCGHCNRRIIKSAADAVQDNNLDSMRRCHWS